MPHRYRYGADGVLKNRRGITSQRDLDTFETLHYRLNRHQPAVGFSPDLDGLKKIHAHLFGDVYEWAGKTRAEEVTIDFQTFTPSANSMSKGEVVFAPSVVIDRSLPGIFDSLKSIADSQAEAGELTKDGWAELTADGIGACNHAHPFMDGNGRAMRCWIEHSARHYGFCAAIPGGQRWFETSHEALDEKRSGALASFIVDNTADSLDLKTLKGFLFKQTYPQATRTQERAVRRLQSSLEQSFIKEPRRFLAVRNDPERLIKACGLSNSRPARRQLEPAFAR